MTPQAGLSKTMQQSASIDDLLLTPSKAPRGVTNPRTNLFGKYHSLFGGCALHICIKNGRRSPPRQDLARTKAVGSLPNGR
jgi:hypothetical protein